MQRLNNIDKKKKILTGVFRFFSLKLLLISLLFLGALLIFSLIVHGAVYGNEAAFDNSVFHFFSQISSERLVATMKFFTFFGSQNFLLPAYVVTVGIFIAMKKYRYGLHIVIVALSSTVLMFVLKNITHRHRPELPIIKGITNYSFPSGHALSAFIFCGILVYIIWHRNWPIALKLFSAALLFLFAATVGISRIVLRVHYPTDVLGSFCLGIVWAILSLWLLRRISRGKTNDTVTLKDSLQKDNAGRPSSPGLQ